MKEVELVIREGDGAWVTDVAGNRYLDATAALWYPSPDTGAATSPMPPRRR